MNEKILRMESSAALAEYYVQRVNPDRVGNRSRDSWTNEAPADAVHFAQHGRDHLVGEAQTMMDKIENAGIELEWPKWGDSVAGAYANVPACLAGLPESMRVKSQQPNDRAPIRVYADLTTSGGIKHEDLTRRGVAMLALSMLLSQQRPVELYAVIALGLYVKGEKSAGIITVRIPAAPLELSTACYVLTSAAFPRELGYRSLTTTLGCGGGWAWGEHPFGAGAQAYTAKMRAALDMANTDLFLPPPHYNMQHDAIISDPVKWINTELCKLGLQAAAN